MEKIPVIVAPMFLVSTPKMVIEASRAGAIGSFPLLNARPVEACAKWLEEIRTALPTEDWAVNFACNKKSNTRYDKDLALISQYQPPIVITSLGHPGDVIDVVKRYGGQVFSDVISVKHAKKAAEAGVDGLVLVCAGAGGHGGTLNPFGFYEEVRSFFDGKITIVGSISSGRDVLAIKVLGADYAYMGTRFIVSKESSTPEDYKNMVIDSSIKDIIYTNAFSGVHANYLIPSIVKSGLDPTQLESRNEVDLSHLVGVKAKAWRDVWSAGHGVGAIQKEQSVSEIVNQLKSEYEEALQQVRHLHEIKL